ncbi:hypothetical protein HHL22_21365 [Hymenobacter sp. RP-2-7]|uniref:DUF4350 domain-containing protein n=1 Tax=Hymenobacter polaris TaxID=2682546 RepID=A0A7Y0AI17_9BACT|nr:DUF4350 domain-containing protein [Hymenobacter polaris]NML67759.1 hypothetical protein [Hymenobacter polaris]
MNTFRWYLVGLLALFGAYVALEYYKPKPLDWTPTLRNQDKIPYGTYALYDVLPAVLGTDSVVSVRLPIFNQLLGADEPVPAASRPTNVAFKDDSADRANDAAAARLAASQQPLTTQRVTYVFVNQSFESSPLETDALLRFIGQGNNVFIAAESFDGRSPSLADSLGVQLVAADTTASLARLRTIVQPRGRARRLASRLPTRLRPDSVALHLLGAAGPRATFRFPAAVAGYRLALTSHYPQRGATLAADAQGRPVLLRLDVGRGHLYLCSVPLALGNYWLLRPQQGDFALAALSALPTGRPVWWDEYQKQGRAGEQSLLRVVLGSPALRAAYYLLLAGALLLVLVEARRRQRVIPVLKPLPNTTLLFTRTVAGLYRQGRRHGPIAEKKVALFLDYLRTRFHEPSPDLADEAFRERLSQKAGLPRARVDELVRLINFARTAPAVTDRELLALSRAISDFRREAGRR